MYSTKSKILDAQIFLLIFDFVTIRSKMKYKIAGIIKKDHTTYKAIIKLQLLGSLTFYIAHSFIKTLQQHFSLII